VAHLRLSVSVVDCECCDVFIELLLLVVVVVVLLLTLVEAHRCDNSRTSSVFRYIQHHHSHRHMKYNILWQLCWFNCGCDLAKWQHQPSNSTSVQVST